jgi:putative transposase
MARFARVVAIDAPRHITQRGNARQVVFEGGADRLVYLDLLRQYCRLDRLKLLDYCLMSNHVHLIAIPTRADSMLLALKHNARTLRRLLQRAPRIVRSRVARPILLLPDSMIVCPTKPLPTWLPESRA